MCCYCVGYRGLDENLGGGGKDGNTIFLCHFSLHGLQKMDLEVRLHIN